MRKRLPFRAFLVFVLLAPLSAEAKSYSAERFDSVVRLLSDGTLDVTETVVFRFEDGTFREVFREIPLRRTDGIEFVEARMQGERLPQGTETGTVEVRRRSSRIRVVWRFPPLEGVTREFGLTYRVRGAVRQTDNADALAWRGTPGEHAYRIDSATIRFELPRAPSGSPEIATRRTQPAHLIVGDDVVEVTAAAIRQNGWIETTLLFPRGAVASAPPLWQQRNERAAAYAGRWVIAAIVGFLGGLTLLFAWRQGYDRPPEDLDIERTPADSWPPDTLAPAVAGVVGANGRPALEHAMAALFAMADRREIAIEEQSRGALGQRRFTVTRGQPVSGLAAYEQALLDIIYNDRAEPGASVDLSQGRSRLTRKFRRFSKEMMRELVGAGLVDASRRELKDRYNRTGVWLLVLAAAAAVPSGFATSEYAGWPVLIPAAIAMVALAAFVFAATITPLSDDGVRSKARWRQYRRQLTAVAQGKQAAHRVPLPSALPFAVALGLAATWSKFLKREGHVMPSWFRALPDSDHGAFVAFVATGGASAHGGGAAGAGGEAGGGASGAS